MDWWLFSFAVGAILSLFIPQVPTVFIILCMLIIALVQFFTGIGRKLSGLLLGAGWVLYCAHVQLSVLKFNDISADEIHLSSHYIEGHITSIVDGDEPLKFNVLVDKFNNKNLGYPFKIRLSWRDAPFQLNQGNRLSLLVKIKPAHGLANPGGFSYQTWLLQKRIVATGYVKKSKDNNILSDGVSVRQRIRANLSDLANDEQNNSALIKALSIGDKSDFTSTHWLLLNNTATQHLMAISGLHVGLIALMGAFVGRFAGVCSLKMTKKEWATSYYFPLIFSLSAAMFYSALAGFSPPTIRALTMITIYWAAKTLGIKLKPTRWVLVSLAAIIMFQPLSLLQTGFWLSLVAVSLVLFVVHFSKQSSDRDKSLLMHYVKSLFLFQLALTVLLTPISVLLFGSLSLLSLPANLFAIPYVSFVLVPLVFFLVFLLSFPDFVSLIYPLINAAFGLLYHWLVLLNSFESHLVFNNEKAIALSALVAMFLFCRLFKVEGKNMLIFSSISTAAILLIVQASGRASNNSWTVKTLDVGHGLAVIIESNGKYVLYDTGARFRSGFSVAESVIHPLVKSQKIEKFDWLIISHDDNDHSGGYEYLKQNDLFNRSLHNLPKEPSSPCVKGESFEWEGLTFRVLWPETLRVDHNDDSCVVLVSDGRLNLLLTGDISSTVERQIVLENDNIEIDMLVAPHHGSMSSSSAFFLNQIKPKQVFISNGYLNRWRMPRPEVMARYEEIGADVYTTVENGMIKAHVTDKGVEVSSYRYNLRPFWHSNYKY